ncbi:MAG: hypothetical protein A2527_13810 [Candidatus Lambdaproteobacteria bacterium RIFOXYD2_FULL_50_16]|uniref:Segregation and condensation protein A n=1 Tax=Candidatus Lambdaproteobacteria bacterium RIFOXYD2_FULL_50_16 TaxID=1817772 RepID=A0A1F6G5C8_9PROT|nr:MAG: hypothetical protein A3K03_07575 [Bdellovibrionales bacterium RIFOXYD1_FULL_44_7]OGG93313.1 MAG: hypothetical protein A2527_13810 [Candidatus Lambdaproteobacteria bacterium RIFOXYD2_FULL_50_16]
MSPQGTALPVQLSFLELLKVRQAAFEGPLALLLDLIKKHKMEIHQICLAEICQPYLDYLGLMERFDLEVAVEFLDIASTLILIKSRSLIPRAEDPEETEGPDPETELKERLAAYQTYRHLAETLNRFELLGRDSFSRPYDLDEAEPGDEILEELTLFRLIDSYVQVLARSEFKKPHQVEAEELSLDQQIEQWVKLFTPGEHHRFWSLVGEEASRPKVVLSFMATLELSKNAGLKLTQAEQFGDLHLYVSDAFANFKAEYQVSRQKMA